MTERDTEQDEWDAWVLGLVMGMLVNLGYSVADAKRVFSQKNIAAGMAIMNKKEAA